MQVRVERSHDPNAPMTAITRPEARAGAKIRCMRDLNAHAGGDRGVAERAGYSEAAHSRAARAAAVRV